MNKNMKNRLRKVIANRTIRFGIVGVGNTLFNFLILNFSFFVLGLNKFAASIVATMCAVALSFLLNRKFVFGHHDPKVHTQAIRFVLVTLTGVLLVQNLVYASLLHILQDNTQNLSEGIKNITGIFLNKDFIQINTSNLVASLATMIWNYNGYRLLVFKSRRSISENIEI